MDSLVTPLTPTSNRLPAVIALVVLGLTGCGEDRLADSKNNSFGSTFEANSTIEAGVVFFGTETYQCFPLSRFGIDQPSDISSIETSCECLTASIVQFGSGSGDADFGLMLKFLDDTDGTETRSFSLAARVILHLKDQSKQEIEVRFLHTFLLPEGGA